MEEKVLISIKSLQKKQKNFLLSPLDDGTAANEVVEVRTVCPLFIKESR